MPRREMARHGQARAHRALRVRRDDADTGAGRFVEDNRVPDIDAELLELAHIEQAVAIVADAGDERRLSSELREGDGRIGDRSAAHELRLVRLVALEERALGGEIDQLHPATLESERGEFVELFAPRQQHFARNAAICAH